MTLEELGLSYLAIEPPDPSYEYQARSPVRVDLSGPDANQLQPPDSFADRFYVSEWNSFIRVAATEAELTWTASPIDRGKTL